MVAAVVVDTHHKMQIMAAPEVGQAQVGQQEDLAIHHQHLHHRVITVEQAVEVDLTAAVVVARLLLGAMEMAVAFLVMVEMAPHRVLVVHQ
jgi:hypothetical protein